MTRAQVIAEARSYVGTPYRHQGRLKGISLDCVGLVVGLGRFVGVPFEDCQTYDKYGRGSSLHSEMDARFLPVPIDSVRPGDMLTFWTFDPERATHAAVVSDLGIIHTHATIKRVVECRLDSWWAGRRISAFSFPGLED